MMLTSFILTFVSILETYELPTGLYELVNEDKTLDKLTKDNVSIDIIKKKSQLKLLQDLRFFEKSFLLQ